MPSSDETRSGASPTDDVLALTVLMAEHTRVLSDLLWSELQVSQTDLFQLWLAATGQMWYPGQTSSDQRVPEGLTASGARRLKVWRRALENLLEVIDADELRYRTGLTRDEASRTVTAFFEESDPEQ